jgi:anaerobic selenocysteine-containing dehydrogenase
MRNTKGGWRAIGWDEALDEIAGRLAQVVAEHGSQAILHYFYSGYTGLIKTVDQIFFNYLGGATTHRGSLCWGAGLAAQRYDFGDIRGHDPQDMTRARTVIIWGRNPRETGIHLMPVLRAAQKAGATVILIDPIETATAKIAEQHIPVRPDSDGALALGMAKLIIERDWIDGQYIAQHVQGFDAFRTSLEAVSLPAISKMTGIGADQIDRLAQIYARQKPSCIIVGYGLQRYRHGGNTVRCIDALGAITGNIGVSGGGINYANRSIARYVGGELQRSAAAVIDRRTFSIARWGAFLETARDPRIECVVVSKANPLVQGPYIQRTLSAFARVPYKVVIDMFMTDTARNADVVLPCTSVLEEEDIIYTSMFHPYLNYSFQAVEPPVGVGSEYDIFQTLARKLGLNGYPYIDRGEFLARAVAPLCKAFDVSMDDLKDGYFCVPGQEVPWRDGTFKTPSGKYELYSTRAQRDGLPALPTLMTPVEPTDEYPLRLITPHTRASLHSQHFAFVDHIPTAYLNHATLKRYRLKAGEQASVISPRGRIRVLLARDDRIGSEIVMIYQGWWHKSGSVNLLTDDGVSDMGEQAAYYDCFCRVQSATASAPEEIHPNLSPAPH